MKNSKNREVENAMREILHDIFRACVIHNSIATNLLKIVVINILSRTHLSNMLYINVPKPNTFTRYFQ